MPYPKTLQAFTRPEFYEEAPAEWERRLREISPITPNMAHLGFRKFAPREDWRESPWNTQPDRPLWAIYTRTPKHLVTPEKAECYRLHWSEVPTTEQVGHRAIVSDYQHFMWHVHGVEVFPLWFLQGEWGGTPAKYTRRETRYLDASGASSVPFAPGTFTPCVFDERAVRGLLQRDRLLQACNRYDELEKMDRPAFKKAEDDAAELLFRETYLDTLSVLMAPAVAYMKSSIGKAEIAEEVRANRMKPAPDGLANTLAQWKDVWKSTGTMLGVGLAPSKKVFTTS